jgi:hypothetical protein
MPALPFHLIWLLSLALPAFAGAVEPPCDQYAASEQPRCLRLWKQLNHEAAEEVSQFGLAQLKRREAGKITQEQHLKENMEFIKRATDRRLKVLADRMAQNQDAPDRPEAGRPPRKSQ